MRILTFKKVKDLFENKTPAILGGDKTSYVVVKIFDGIDFVEKIKIEGNVKQNDTAIKEILRDYNKEIFKIISDSGIEYPRLIVEFYNEADNKITFQELEMKLITG